jgi:alpha-amylase
MNGVLLQGFHWFLKPDFPQSSSRRLWAFLRDEADHYRFIGIDAVWIPPASRGENPDGVGYDVYDHYNTGEFALNGRTHTRYGTKDELKEAIAVLHGDGTQRRLGVYADIVLNHKAGGAPMATGRAIRVEKSDRTQERWGEGWERGKIELKGYTRFDHPERGGTYSTFQWRARHFDSVDTAVDIRQDGHTFPTERDADRKSKYIYRFLYNEAATTRTSRTLTGG